MRRILLAAFAVLLLHAAPSMAAECSNLALTTNGGTASASSSYGGYGPAVLNDGRRQTSSQTYWNDATQGAYPDWAQVAWSSPTAINRIVLRAPVWSYGTAPSGRILFRVRVQYYDDANATWVDVAGRTGQFNPISYWISAETSADGREVKTFDFTTVRTSKIRAYFERGSWDGWSLLEEIEAYEGDGSCTKPGVPEPPARTPIDQCNLAVDAIPTASSVHTSGSYPISAINNGRRESGTSQGYWNDDTNGTWPDWAQLEWEAPVTLDRIVARIPLARTGFPVGEITLRRTRIQYWNDMLNDWTDVIADNGQANPIVDWTGPIGTYDGSESRTFEFVPITTRRIRALIEDGSTDGWSWLDELEAYSSSDCTTSGTTPRDVNLALAENGGEAIASSYYPGTSPGTGWLPAAMNDGRGQAYLSPFWNDYTKHAYPDWAVVRWTGPRQINRIVLRGPIFALGTAAAYRTLGRLTVQYYEPSTRTWVAVSGASGQDNPIVDWELPDGTADGSEIRTFDLATPITARRIRAYFERGDGDGWSYLEEFEAYWIS